MKQIIYLNPSYSSFHFFIYDCDSNIDEVLSEAKYHDLIYEDRYYQDKNVIVIGTKSDYLPVELIFEISEEEINHETNNEWEKVIKSKFEINNKSIRLFDPPDGEFASIDIPNGRYNIKIFYGENQKKNDFSDDFYLFQIWPDLDE